MNTDEWDWEKDKNGVSVLIHVHPWLKKMLELFWV